MKKLILSAAICLGAVFVSQNVQAQFASSNNTSTFFSTEKSGDPIRFGIRGGLNFSSFGGDFEDIIRDFSGEDFESKINMGFNVGVIVDIPVTRSFYVQSGLSLTTKGFKIECKYQDEEFSEKFEGKGKGYYLQIPVLASYRYHFNDDLQWQLNVGPYFAYGLGGKFKEKDTYNEEGYSEVETAKTDFFGFDYDAEDYEDMGFGIKRFDCGLILGTGITYRNMYFGLQYDLGLTNVADSDMWGGNASFKTRNFSVNIGYNF